MKTLHKGIWYGGTPAIGEVYESAHGGKIVDGVPVGYGYHTEAFKDPSLALGEAKTTRIALVKVEAGQRIAALDWQLQRADRHTELNKTPKKARALVLTAQQKIEDDSDLAEEAINTLATPEEVNAFTW